MVLMNSIAMLNIVLHSSPFCRVGNVNSCKTMQNHLVKIAHVSLSLYIIFGLTFTLELNMYIDVHNAS